VVLGHLLHASQHRLAALEAVLEDLLFLVELQRRHPAAHASGCPLYVAPQDKTRLSRTSVIFRETMTAPSGR
jgi:hypothetical protein